VKNPPIEVVDPTFSLLSFTFLGFSFDFLSFLYLRDFSLSLTHYSQAKNDKTCELVLSCLFVIDVSFSSFFFIFPHFPSNLLSMQMCVSSSSFSPIFLYFHK